jgi:hypothetical protein
MADRASRIRLLRLPTLILARVFGPDTDGTPVPSGTADDELDRRLRVRRRRFLPVDDAGGELAGTQASPAAINGMTWGSSDTAWARPVKKRMPRVYKRPRGIGESPPA